MSARKRAKIDNGETINQENIRSDLFDEAVITAVQSLWNLATVEKIPKVFNIGSDDGENAIKVVNYPFSVCIVPNLVKKEIISNIHQDLYSQVQFTEKNNDLYQFKQTADVANLTGYRSVKELYSLICNDLFRWVEKTFAPTGLKEHVAATFSSYTKGDRLLCHDDQCEDRHIAFVLYLTEGWTTSDGGCLDLFDVDDNKDPNRVVLSLTPYFNTLVLFEVNEKSFHQVSEVIAQKERLSINGWFHKADLPPRAPSRLYEMDTYMPTSTEFDLDDYMFDKYLTLSNQIDIQTLFITNSELQLDNFFIKDVFKKITQEFSSTDITWKTVGPANMRHYEVPAGPLSGTLKSLNVCLQSRTWLRFLQNISGLDFIPTPNTDLTSWQKGILPTCKIQLERWLPGSYTLIHDKDPEFHIDALDVFLRVPVCEEDNEDDIGETPQAGHIIYIDKDSKDEECLLHLGYKMNSMCLIFREPGTLRFTKYLDLDSTPFYQIHCTYLPWAPPPDEPDLKHRHSDDESEPESDEDPTGEEEGLDEEDAEETDSA